MGWGGKGTSCDVLPKERMEDTVHLRSKSISQHLVLGDCLTDRDKH